jgi:hypothetical protein
MNEQELNEKSKKIFEDILDATNGLPSVLIVSIACSVLFMVFSNLKLNHGVKWDDFKNDVISVLDNKMKRVEDRHSKNIH